MKKIISIILTVALVLALCTLFPAAADPVRVDGYTGGTSVGIWMGTSNGRFETQTVLFNAGDEFTGFGLPNYWASNSDSNEPDVTFTFSLYNYDTDVATSVKGTPVFSQTENPHGDQPEGVLFDFGKALPKGEYVAEFKVVSDVGYLVLPSASSAFNNLYLEFAGSSFGFYVNFVNSGLSKYFKKLSSAAGQYAIEEPVICNKGDTPVDVKGAEMAVHYKVPADRKLLALVGITSPTWTNPGGGSDATLEAYAWTGDYDSSVDGAVLATAEVFDHADNADLVLTLDNPLPAGDYLFTISGTGDMAVGFWCNSSDMGQLEDVYLNGSETTNYPGLRAKLQVMDDDDEPATEENPPVVESFIKAVSRDQLMIDGADRAKFGGNDAVTDVDLKADVGKELKIWGWVGTTSPIKGFGYRVNGQEVSDPSFVFEAEPGVINAAAEKGATEASRYAIMFPVTEGVYTVEAFVTTDAGTETIWTINVVAGDAPQPATGDASVAMIAVLVVLTMGAAVVFARKKSY